MTEFREDRLQLLGPEIHTMDPEAYFNRILGMYQPKVAGGKAKEPELKGKKLKVPTKKTPGVFEMKYPTALGERRVGFMFDKRNLFRDDFVKQACEHLMCSEQKLISFLEKKKFSISPCLDEAMRLHELLITLIEQKETNHAPSSSA